MTDLAQLFGESEESGSEPKVHQIGADTRAHTEAGLTPAERRELRETVRTWVHELDLRAPEVRARLKREQGLEVPASTAARWVRAARLTAPPPSLQSVSDRALRLISSEVKRLELQPASHLDLDRLGKATQILKTLQGLKPLKAERNGPRTLQDLTAGQSGRSGKA
jgi:hypothetical protein